MIQASLVYRIQFTTRHRIVDGTDIDQRGADHVRAVSVADALEAWQAAWEPCWSECNRLVGVPIAVALPEGTRWAPRTKAAEVLDFGGVKDCPHE